jgi:hypothetical protein
MIKSVTLAIGVLSVFCFLVLRDAKAAQISDLRVTGVENVNVGQVRTIMFTLKSSDAPEDLFIEYSGGGRRVTWSWKKNQVEVTTERKEDAFEVIATRPFNAGPTGGFTLDTEVWVTVGGKKSNTLKAGIQIGTATETKDPRTGTTLPADMKVDRPSASAPHMISSLSGIWQGSDNFGTLWTVVVESITAEGVVGIWSWGAHPGRNAGWLRVKGKVEGETIVFAWEFPPDPVATLRLKVKGEKNAFADFAQGGLRLKAWLSKAQ